jgi:hypothetical protein
MGCIYKLYFEGNNNEAYIGQTRQNINRRIIQHRTDAIKNNTDKQKWILSNGRFLLKYEILYVGNDLDFLEKKAIKEYKEKGFKLYNLTNGGSGIGTSGYKHTEKEKIRRSLENHSRDYKVYTFLNKNGDSFIGDRLSFSKYSKLKIDVVGQLVRKEKQTRNGWYEKNAFNINGNKKARNNNIYKFEHEKHGKIECTCYELRNKYNLDESKIYMVASGKRKHHKGWFLNNIKKTTNPAYPFVYNKPIIRCNKEIIKKYSCINEIIIDMNMRRTASHYIKMCCEGNKKSYLGYTWSYI